MNLKQIGHVFIFHTKVDIIFDSLPLFRIKGFVEIQLNIDIIIIRGDNLEGSLEGQSFRAFTFLVIIFKAFPTLFYQAILATTINRTWFGVPIIAF